MLVFLCNDPGVGVGWGLELFYETSKSKEVEFRLRGDRVYDVNDKSDTDWVEGDMLPQVR